MFVLKRSWMAVALACVAITGAVTAQAPRSPNFTHDFGPWEKHDGKEIGPCYACRYQAFDKKGERVNQQVLWYIPTPPMGTDKDWSNHWIYWYNPGKDVIWGRCPTPNHPQYKQWQKEQKGQDLWQLIAEKDRKPGAFITEVASLFGPTISTEQTGLPQVLPKDKIRTDPIPCVDFKNAIFN